MTIVEFLQARIDEDEDEWPELLHQRQRVLREVEAKRAIIREARAAIAAGEIQPGSTWNDDAAGMEVALIVLRHLASVYADHPDYDQAWKV